MTLDNLLIAPKNPLDLRVLEADGYTVMRKIIAAPKDRIFDGLQLLINWGCERGAAIFAVYQDVSLSTRSIQLWADFIISKENYDKYNEADA